MLLVQGASRHGRLKNGLAPWGFERTPSRHGGMKDRPRAMGVYKTGLAPWEFEFLSLHTGNGIDAAGARCRRPRYQPRWKESAKGS
jgi:hypothetical protein